MRIDNQYTTMMTDIEKTDKMFGVVFSDGKGQFCEIGTAVENIKQEFYRGKWSLWVWKFYYFCWSFIDYPLVFFFTCLFIRLFLFLNTSCIPHHYFFYRSNSFQSSILSNFFEIIGGGQQLQNICRQRFRILKIIQVEPYLIADVEYGISGRFVYLSFYNLSEK